MKRKILIALSIILLSLSICLQTVDAIQKDTGYNLEYEYINIKDMAVVQVSTKEVKESFLDSLINSDIMSFSLASNDSLEEVSLPPIKTIKEVETPRQIWYLPTEIGNVTQNPHYGHAALDITSPRGTKELIFPVANGTVSGIYTDPAGALVVTVLHNINGVKYTSQYAHLSSYANGLYVGKDVTINDYLGRMGNTGYSTGTHLHLAVLDCALFERDDSNCSDLNGFFRYANTRLGQGYIGLGSMMYVPGSWNSR